MTLDEAFKVADEALFAHTGKQLTDLQRMILQESWADKSYMDMQGKNWELPTIRKAGNQLWNLLSKALGEEVSKTSFRVLSRYVEAVDYLQQSLYSDHKSFVKKEVWRLASTQGLCPCTPFTNPLGLLYLAKKIGDRYGEAVALGNLGVTYSYLGQYQQAVDLYKQALRISEEIGNPLQESTTLCNISYFSYLLGQYQESIEYGQQALTIAQKINAKEIEGYTQTTLGLAYERLKQYEQAIECHQQALIISQETGDRRNEGNASGNLGIVYTALNNYKQAIQYYQHHLRIAQEIRDRRGEGIALVNWGYTLVKLNEKSEALERLQQSLEIFREISDQGNEAEALLRLAELHHTTGLSSLAKKCCDRALELAIKLGIPLQEECQKLKAELETGGG